jgi:predicted Zn-dependent protease
MKTTRRKFLHTLGAGAAAGIVFAGCKSMDTMSQVMAVMPREKNKKKTSRALSLFKVSTAVAKSFESFTPEQEYYIGRTVGAMALEKYPAFYHPGANTYINLLGQALAAASDRPETFGGYRFQIQDSSEINAFAAPGGFIFVTRGLIRCCRDEDALAAVLAHEIGHVQEKHGLKAIQQSRITNALTILGLEGAKQFGGKELAALTQTFEDSISDITHTLMVKGYSRSQERQADQAAVKILKGIGYHPQGIMEMLNQMKTRLSPGGLDFAKTHPSPEQRLRALEPRIGPYMPYTQPRARMERFIKQIAWV